MFYSNNFSQKISYTNLLHKLHQKIISSIHLGNTHFKPYICHMKKYKHDDILEPEEINIADVMPVIDACFDPCATAERKKNIDKLMSFAWCKRFECKVSGTSVLGENYIMPKKQAGEMITSIYLIQLGYNVIVPPKEWFALNGKKFDIFLVIDDNIMKAGLKYITTDNAVTMAKRINYGSEQASAMVVTIESDINKEDIIDALRRSVKRNSQIIEIALISKGEYKKVFYRLPKSLILSEEIYNYIK